MHVPPGSVIEVNLRCGCISRRITLIRGEQRIKCPQCGRSTRINIFEDNNGNISRIETVWA